LSARASRITIDPDAAARPSDRLETGIAIVGMGCIFPAESTPRAFWRFLREGRDAITECRRSDGISMRLCPDPDAGKNRHEVGWVRRRHRKVRRGLLRISPREAAVMDPQQRLLLETAWRALETLVFRSSGSPARAPASTSASPQRLSRHPEIRRYDIDVHTSTGGALSIAANRLSHRFDLRGPSLSIDTACSSSLVALHVACAAIHAGECDLALVGGVNAILTPDVTISSAAPRCSRPMAGARRSTPAPTATCAAKARVVVLKPFARARIDGDRIHGVIRATNVNQDGRTTTITVPASKPRSRCCGRPAGAPGSIQPRSATWKLTAPGPPSATPSRPKRSDAYLACPCGRRSVPDRVGKTNIGHLERPPALLA